MKRKLILLGALVFCYQLNVKAQSYVIDKVGGYGFCANGPANQAYLYGATSLALDQQGNAYVGLGNSHIVKVSTSGIVTKFAGTGDRTTSGDGGLAVNAGIGDPYSICTDKLGNIYFAEQNQGYIRKIDINGVITTIAGNGQNGSSGDGGPALNASFSVPSSIAIDKKGNIYVGDAFNNKIRKIDANGIITTFAGTGNLGFSGDGGLAINADISRVAALDVDDAGNLYFGDWFNYRIRKIDVNGIITTIAGNGTSGFSGEGGLAKDAVIGSVTGLTIDNNTGNIYFTCGYSTPPTDLNRVLKINSAGIISTIAYSKDWNYSGDGGLAIAAEIAEPGDIKCDANGNIYFVERTNEVVRKVNSSNIISTIAGNHSGGYCGNGIPALNASFAKLSSITLDAQENILFSEEGRVRKIDAAGLVWDYAGNGIVPSYYTVPAGDGGNALNASLDFTFITKDNNGNLFGGSNGKAIRKINASGGISFYGGNYLYTGDLNNGFSVQNAAFNGIYNACYDNKNNCLYVSDKENNKIHKIDANGLVTTICGTGTAGNTGDGGLAVAAQIEDPEAITVDGNGNVYFTEAGSNVGIIRKISPNGIISRFAGTGAGGFSGDGGAAINADISVYGLATDKANNIYFSAGEYIRKIDGNGIISTIAGNGSNGPELNGVNALTSSMSANNDLVVTSTGVVYFNQMGNKIRKLIPGVAAVPEVNKNAAHTVYPNPSQGKVTFKTAGADTQLELRLVDVLGKQVETRILNGFEQSFNFSGLENGVYSYTIGNKKEIIYSGKLVISHE